MDSTRAKWYQNSDTTYILKMPHSVVLATIRERRDGPYIRDYVWNVGDDAGGRCDTLYAAQRAARRALREGVVTKE
jgi:hypothetical protein